MDSYKLQVTSSKVVATTELGAIRGEDWGEALSAQPRTRELRTALDTWRKPLRSLMVLRRRHVVLTNCGCSLHACCSSEHAGATVAPRSTFAALRGEQ